MSGPVVPRLSIVTAVLNRRDMLRAAIASIDAHDDDIEHIVVDGGSTDGTQDVVRELGRSRLIDAPGTGIYDAMDIGIRAARGALVGLLNSDDWYLPGGLARILQLHETHPTAQLISAGAQLWDEASGHVAVSGAPADRALDARQLILGAVDINARFFSPALYAAVGGFDLAYPCGADRHLLLKMARRAPTHVVVEDVIYRYRAHAGSFTFQPSKAKRVAMAREQADMIARVLGEAETPADWRGPLMGAWAATEARLAILQPIDALQRLPRHVRHDPWFPLRLSAEVAQWISRRRARARLTQAAS